MDSISSPTNRGGLIAEDIRVFWSSRHPLTIDWPFTGVQYVAGSMFAYFLLCLAGMYAAKKNAFKYELEGLMRVYNLVQVLLSAYMFSMTFRVFKHHLETNEKGVFCLPSRPDKPLTYYDQLQATAIWWYYMTKFLDFIDTIFIILRGRWRQLSFLHMYHHLSVVLISWIPLAFLPYGQNLPGVLFNTLVHTVMYSYYLLSSFPALRRHLWWKRYLTQFQIVQFMYYMGVMIGDMFLIVTGPCRGTLSFLFAAVTISYAVSMFTLFMAFYKGAYNKAKKED